MTLLLPIRSDASTVFLAVLIAGREGAWHPVAAVIHVGVGVGGVACLFLQLYLFDVLGLVVAGPQVLQSFDFDLALETGNFFGQVVLAVEGIHLRHGSDVLGDGLVHLPRLDLLGGLQLLGGLELLEHGPLVHVHHALLALGRVHHFLQLLLLQAGALF